MTAPTWLVYPSSVMRNFKDGCEGHTAGYQIVMVRRPHIHPTREANGKVVAWRCGGDGCFAFGTSPKLAYENWRTAVHVASRP